MWLCLQSAPYKSDLWTLFNAQRGISQLLGDKSKYKNGNEQMTLWFALTLPPLTSPHNTMYRYVPNIPKLLHRLKFIILFLGIQSQNSLKYIHRHIWQTPYLGYIQYEIIYRNQAITFTLHSDISIPLSFTALNRIVKNKPFWFWNWNWTSGRHPNCLGLSQQI